MTIELSKIKTFVLALTTVLALLAQPSLAAEEVETPDPAQIARGAKAWSENCGRCHNMRSPKELTDEEWMVSVTHMRVIANLPGNVADDIIEFLKSSN